MCVRKVSIGAQTDGPPWLKFGMEDHMDVVGSFGSGTPSPGSSKIRVDQFKHNARMQASMTDESQDSFCQCSLSNQNATGYRTSAATYRAFQYFCPPLPQLRPPT